MENINFRVIRNSYYNRTHWYYSVEKLENNLRKRELTEYSNKYWIIYEDLGENYILLNTNTNEKLTEVYDEGNERFLSAQEAVDALNNIN